MITDPEVDINIKDLVLDESVKAKLKLDPEHDVTENDWDKLRAEFDWYKKEGRYQELLSTAVYVKLFDPQRLEQLVDLEALWPEQQKLWDYDSKPNSRAEDTLNEAYRVKVLYPNHPLDYDPKEWWNNPISRIDPQFVGDDALSWSNYTSRLLRIKFLDPNLMGLKITDQMWEKMKGSINELQQEKQILFDLNILEMAASMKILAPERWNGPNMESTISIISDVYNHALSENRDSTGTFSGFFFEKMTAARIIVAQEAKITEHGLELKMPEPELELNEKPPETRRF